MGSCGSSVSMTAARLHGGAGSSFGLIMSPGFSNMLSDRRYCLLGRTNWLDGRLAWPTMGEPFRTAVALLRLENCGLARTAAAALRLGLLALLLAL